MKKDKLCSEAFQCRIEGGGDQDGISVGNYGKEKICGRDSKASSLRRGSLDEWVGDFHEVLIVNSPSVCLGQEGWEEKHGMAPSRQCGEEGVVSGDAGAQVNRQVDPLGSQ